MCLFAWGNARFPTFANADYGSRELTGRTAAVGQRRSVTYPNEHPLSTHAVVVDVNTTTSHYLTPRELSIAIAPGLILISLLLARGLANVCGSGARGD
jgi:hypothetical protein